MDVKSMVEGYRDLLLERLDKLVAINSEESAPVGDAPFGNGPKEALEVALDMLKEDGCKVVNLDNYAGYGEIGEGEESIGIVGHLDIVPAHKEDGWNTDPFKMTEKDGILYGRGVSDDKGAVVASMIALKVIKDMNIPLNKRIRLIMGTNEETGSKCLEYYVKKEGSPTYGFTPDGDFPCIYGEKGMTPAVYRSKSTTIRDIKGGTAKNIVCRNCYVVVDKNTFSRKSLEDFFNNNEIEYNIEENDTTVKISAQGVAAHGSMPELGKNALAFLLVGLKEAGFQDPFVDFFCSRIGLNTDGEGLGIKCNDEYGALTLNAGVIEMKDGVIEGTLDIRFPVTMSSRQIVKKMEEFKETDGGIVEITGTVEPLFYPADSPLVTSLTEAYQEVTGDTENLPMVIGGGTYAKGIENTIAFGCAFPGKDYHIHDANEWVEIDELLKQAEIYVAGILKLLSI